MFFFFFFANETNFLWFIILGQLDIALTYFSMPTISPLPSPNVVFPNGPSFIPLSFKLPSHARPY